jgi:DNA-binding CsgD family transcriptional regulator
VPRPGQSLTPEDPFALSVWSFADFSEKRPVVTFSVRERQVAMLLTAGKTSKEIARHLTISPRTVEAHRAHLLAKLGARNSAELIARVAGVPL